MLAECRTYTESAGVVNPYHNEHRKHYSRTRSYGNNRYAAQRYCHIEEADCAGGDAGYRILISYIQLENKSSNKQQGTTPPGNIFPTEANDAAFAPPFEQMPGGTRPPCAGAPSRPFLSRRRQHGFIRKIFSGGDSAG